MARADLGEFGSQGVCLLSWKLHQFGPKSRTHTQVKYRSIDLGTAGKASSIAPKTQPESPCSRISPPPAQAGMRQVRTGMGSSLGAEAQAEERPPEIQVPRSNLFQCIFVHKLILSHLHKAGSRSHSEMCSVFRQPPRSPPHLNTR